MSGPVLYTECAVELLYSIVPPLNEAGLEKQKRLFVQLTSSRVRLGQSFKTVGYGSASCWGDVGPEV